MRIRAYQYLVGDDGAVARELTPQEAATYADYVLHRASAWKITMYADERTGVQLMRIEETPAGPVDPALADAVKRMLE